MRYNASFILEGLSAPVKDQPHVAPPDKKRALRQWPEGFYGDDPPPRWVRLNKNNNRGKAENGHK